MRSEDEVIVSDVLAGSESRLRNLFEGMFGEEIESECMLEFMVEIQLYAALCIRLALALKEREK